MLRDGRFWVGVIVGVAAVYAWHIYQAKKAAQG